MATGLLFAARGLGALVGPLHASAGSCCAAPGCMPGLAMSMVGYGVAYLGVAASPWFWLALVLVVLAHVAGGGNWVMSNYALQLEVPDELRGPGLRHRHDDRDAGDLGEPAGVGAVWWTT